MKHCIVCGAPLSPAPLLVLDHMPTGAQQMPRAEELAQDAGMSLRLCQCSGCGLIQLDCAPVPYYRDVLRVGRTDTVDALRNAQCGALIEQYALHGKKVVEIGCGRGEYLRVLARFPVEAFGVEHQQASVRAACEEGLQAAQAFCGAEDVKLPNGPFAAFFCFNFLEHQPDPNAMLRCVWNNLEPGGVGLVTVPCWEYIAQQGDFYDLVRDHLAYYTRETLRFLMEKNGFSVLETSIVNENTLSVTVQKRRPAAAHKIAASLASLPQSFDAFLRPYEAKGQRVAMWGASHQCFTLLSAAHLEKRIAYIIDSAQQKQGRFAPASHVPIVPPAYFFEAPAAAILIAALEFTEEIAAAARQQFGPDVVLAALRGQSLEILEKNR